MKVLVTGGAGFIGSHLTHRLVEMGNDVVVLDNLCRGNKLDPKTVAKIELVVADIRDHEAVLRAAKGCSQIYHLAAVLGVDLVADNPIETMDTEVMGMRVVCDAAARNSSHIVYASTSGVYGKAAIGATVDENFQASPSSSYAIAKRFNEIYLIAQQQERRLSSVSIRYFNVYGPKQDERMVIPRFLRQATNGEPITVFGTGKQSRDFTYIDDVVEGTIRCGTTVRGSEIVNIARGKETSVVDLAQTIVRMMKSSSKIECITPPPGRYDFEVERRVGHSGKLRRLVDFEPTIDLEEGLRRIMAKALQ